MPAIATAASAGVKAATGIWEIYKGTQLANDLTRPKYEIPQAVQDKMTTAEMLQYQGLPETQKQEYIDNLSRNMAFAFNQADSRKGGLTGVAAINQQASDAAKGLLSADAQARMENINKLQTTRSEYGGFQDKEFTFNEANPYYETMNQAEALKGAGMQNLGLAVNEGATALGNQYGNNTATTPAATTQNPAYIDYAKKNKGTIVNENPFQ